MDLALKLFGSYMLISFSAGIVVMVMDASRGFALPWASKAVAFLYLPPLGIVGAGILVAALSALWRF